MSRPMLHTPRPGTERRRDLATPHDGTPAVPSALRPSTIAALGALLLVLALNPGVAAETLYVANNGTDNGICSQAAPCGTLGHAVTFAAAGDTIKVGKGTFGGGVTIDKDLTIDGAGALSTRISSAWDVSGVLNIEDAAVVQIKNLQITKGGSKQPPGGGGILNRGTLTLEGVWVRSNDAAFAGGGILNLGTLVMQGGEIALNGSDVAGGGLFNDYGAVAILVNVRVAANRGYGGAIYNKAALIVHSSLVAVNRGGGIWNDGDMQLTNVTVSGNHDGPAVLIDHGYAELVNVTIAENKGPHGLFVLSYADVVLVNTIIANNAGKQCAIDPLASVTITSSLDSDTTCFTWPEPGDQVGVDPRLGPLKNNGGPTWTHALKADSPAIDSGSDDHCPAVDQRGALRPVDGDLDGDKRCDIGAYEVGLVRRSP